MQSTLYTELTASEEANLFGGKKGDGGKKGGGSPTYNQIGIGGNGYGGPGIINYPSYGSGSPTYYQIGIGGNGYGGPGIVNYN